jgi:NTE family protein
MKTDIVPKIGVAFSGGGVRGLAHLGVLQVLEQAEVSVDMVAGTSMGGLVAGLYAAGVPLQDLVEFACKIGIMDFASPDRAWRGLFNHKKMSALLGQVLGRQDITFEELDIPAAVVATDIETAEIVVLDQGPLIPALMATSAFPILFSPVRHQDRWLVDGGALNNLPVDIVRHMGADRVLGVNVPSRLTLALENEERAKGLSPRGLLTFSSRTHNWRLPFLIAEASMGITAQTITRTRLALCPPDLLLQVDLPNVGLFAMDKSAEIIETGRRAAWEHQAELVALSEKPLPPRWQRRRGRAVHRLRRAWRVLREPAYPPYLDQVSERARQRDRAPAQPELPVSEHRPGAT